MVRLRTSPGGSVELGLEVLTGALDLALLSIPGEAPPGLSLRVLVQETLVVICSPSHPLASAGGAAEEVTLAMLAGESFIDFPAGWGNRAVVDQAFAAVGLDRQVSFEVADFGDLACCTPPEEAGPWPVPRVDNPRRQPTISAGRVIPAGRGRLAVGRDATCRGAGARGPEAGAAAP